MKLTASNYIREYYKSLWLWLLAAATEIPDTFNTSVQQLSPLFDPLAAEVIHL
jgi:hypothetical protein